MLKQTVESRGIKASRKLDALKKKRAYEKVWTLGSWSA